MLADIPPRLTRLHPDDLHSTVAFLGKMEHALVPDMLDALRSIRLSPTRVRFGRLVGLPNPDRPSAFSFELAQGGAPLVELIARHRDSLVDLAEGPKEERAPYPHVTVARPPRRCSPDVRSQAIAWARAVPPPTGEVRVSEVVLFRSVRNAGRSFQVVA